MILQSGSTRASGTWKVSVIAEADERTEDEEVTYTMNIYNNDVDSSIAVASTEFTIRDTSVDHPPTYTLSSNKTNNAINERGGSTQITYTLKSYGDTGGDDGKGGNIEDGDTFTRYWRLVDSGDTLSDNTNVDPYRGSVTMTIDGRKKDDDDDDQPYAEGTFKVKAIKDYKDEVDPGEYDSVNNKFDYELFDMEIFYTEEDRDKKTNDVASFTDALRVNDTSIPIRYFAQSNDYIQNQFYTVEEGKSLTVYLNLTDPKDTEVTFEIDSPDSDQIPTDYTAGDGDDFVPSSKQTLSGGVLTQKVKSKAYTTSVATYVVSQATCTFACKSDKETEGWQAASLKAYINGEEVYYSDQGSYMDKWRIHIDDKSRDPYYGCPDEDQYFSESNDDRGSCPVKIAGQVSLLPVNRWQLSGATDGTIPTYPNLVYLHETKDNINTLSGYPTTGSEYYFKVGRVGYVMWARYIPATEFDNCGSILAQNVDTAVGDRWGWGQYGTGFDYPYCDKSDTTKDDRYWFDPNVIVSDSGFPNYTNARLNYTELFRGHLVPLWYAYKNERIYTKIIDGESVTLIRRYNEIYATDKAEIETKRNINYWTLANNGNKPVAFIFGSSQGIISNIRLKNMQPFTKNPDFPSGACTIGYWYEAPDE